MTWLWGAPQTETGAPVFTIVTVCTGNICRSPLAEQLIRSGLAGDPRVDAVRVHSAGTHALVGEPEQEQNQRIAKRFGVTDMAEHRARQVTEPLLADADLVLALSREHRREVVSLVPRLVRRTFTLREFARLAAVAPARDAGDLAPDQIAAQLRAAVEAVGSVRGTIAPPDEPEADDVIDPYRRDESVYEAQADQLVPAVSATVRYLRASVGLSI